MKTRQMTPFFLSAFGALFRKLILTFKNCRYSFSWGPPFGPFWSAKYLNLGGETCKIRILSHSIQETHIEESKKRGFTFSIQLRIISKIFRVLSWSISTMIS